MAVIPRVKFDIDPLDPMNGVKVISLVDEPAIESDFIFFNKEESNYIQLKGEQYKQVVAGLALIPDKDILRYDAMGLPFYAYFTKEGIEQIRNKFHKELLINRVNTDHNSANYVDAFLIESYLIDSEQRLADVKAKGIEEAVIGSWFVAYKIEDKNTFDRVIAGELKGFSVEIFLSKFNKVDNNLNQENILEKMMNKFLEKFKALLVEFEKEQSAPIEEPKSIAKDAKVFEQAKTADGITIEYGAIGEAANIVKEDGSKEPAPDGEYSLDNGKIVSVASGVVADIKEAPSLQEQKSEAKTEVKAVQDNSELEKVKSELERVKSDLKKSNDELATLKTENEKLKKAPLANPVLKQEKKVAEIDYTKLSNAERLRLKYNLQ